MDYASNTCAALELAERTRPEVVLLDPNLPGMSGFEVCRRIKANPELRQARVIALRRTPTRPTASVHGRAGCERHLVKPVPPYELARVHEG